MEEAALLQQTQFLSPSSTLSPGAFDNSRRPPTPETGRERALSLTNQSPTSAHFERLFEEGCQSSGSRHFPSIVVGPVISAMPQIVSGPRQRAGSARFSLRSPIKVIPPPAGTTANRQPRTLVAQTHPLLLKSGRSLQRTC